MPNKLGDPAGCHYLVTTLTFYYSTVTDLSLSRSVHATELEPCCPDPFLLSSSECRAIHYGQCSSLLKLPTFSIVPANCRVEARDTKPSTLAQHEESVLRLPRGASKNVPRYEASESPEKDNCNSLELLAANIEENIKPFLNILSSCETTDSLDTNEEDSIGNLATSLQYHLGNFIAAVRQQQQQVSYSEADQKVKETELSDSFYSADIVKKKSINSTENEPRPLSDLSYDSDGSSFNFGRKNDIDWPSRCSLSATSTGPLDTASRYSLSATRTKNYIHKDLEKGLNLNTHGRNKEQNFVSKVTDSLDTKQNCHYSSEVSLAKQREVMRILNKTDSVKSTLCNNTDTVDSELLDSLISLMNVSLVDLEDPPQKKNHYQKGKICAPNTKIASRSDSKAGVSECRDLRDSTGRKEGEKTVDNVQHPPCRKKLIFDVEDSSERFVTTESHRTTAVPGKMKSENGVLGVFPTEILNRGDWSISSFHRRDSVIPSLPLVQDVKRVYTDSRYTNATDHKIVSTRKASVAERVLAFEKRPDWTTERSNSVKDFNRKVNKEKECLQVLPKKIKHSSRSTIPENSAVKLVRKPSQIPKFYFPNGQPSSHENVEIQTERLKNVFADCKGKYTFDTFHIITKTCSLPLYWKMPLYLAVGTDKLNYITTNKFLDFWKRMTSTHHDEASQFVYILSRGKRSYLLPEDFRPMIQDIVDTHPGLMFLRDSKEFHSRYVDTVIARIFYDVNRAWSGNITASELRRSNFLQAVADLEEDDDINQMTDYFSYEHFYVIYCKFWKIDTDHDLLVDKRDFRHHNNGDISSRMIDRIFSGAVSREMLKTGHMRYTDFVWFLLAEEDKRHPRSIEYWFRCMDLNGDGFLSMYELEYFYDEQARRMEASGLEAMPFKDCLCQMLDMVRPKTPEKISLSDLKQCKLTTLFFDTFFNLGKFLEHEQRDPFAAAKLNDSQAPEISDWCKYAEEEYNHLISEENYGYSDRYQGAGHYYCAENAAFSKPECMSKTYSKSCERDDDDDYADSDADY